MAAKVVTRFAPSPTGFLHIGGARTALFNWLFAKAKGGRFLLRIEDTDRARSTDAAITAILDGLDWLGLASDAAPVYQFAGADRHREIAQQLIDEGKAYQCYCTPDELAEMRQRAEDKGGSPGYDGRWRDRDASDAPPGVAPAIRFKAPRAGETIVDDQVQGRVVFDNAVLDDLVLLRSDGTPTYMLSVVVDDHDMGISHVIRGVDHLTNAARQSQIYKALDWTTPIFAHVPLIHGPDGAKLSKRHGALGVEAYRAMGYLPEAMRNYLVRLGWSHGDEEFFSTKDLIRLFDLPAIGRSPSRFDFDKLDNLNAHYIRQADDTDLVARIKSLLPEMDGGPELAASIDEADWAKLGLAMPGLKARAKTLVELIDKAGFLFARRPLKIDPKAAKSLKDDAKNHLSALATSLAQIDDWQAETIEAAVRDYAEAADLKLGKVAQPLRAALTGSTVSPPIFDVLYVLGREEALGRIRDQLA